MVPTLKTGQIVIASGRFHRLHAHNMVIIQHQGLEKIKRITEIDPERGIYVQGDNPMKSTDSRHFGWLPLEAVVAKVYWPRTS